MIQIASFSFELLEAKDNNYWVHFARFGRLLSYDFQQYSNMDEIPTLLSEGKVYQIGLDQSTSVAGVFIKDYKNTEAYMIEVSKNKGENADDFIFNFELLIHKLTEGRKVSHLIYERPIKKENYRSSQVLFQLEGNVRAWVKRYKDFHSAMLDYIENSAWRSVVILDKYARTLERKEASKESIRELLPWSCYYLFCLGPDCDVYEAMGVLFGWFFCSFDRLGRPYVRGDRYTGNIGGFILPNAPAEEVSKQLQAAKIDTEWWVQNPRKSIYENLVSAVKKYKVVCVEITDPFAILSLTVECGFKWDEDPSILTAVLVASNYVDKTLFSITGSKYHFIL